MTANREPDSGIVEINDRGEGVKAERILPLKMPELRIGKLLDAETGFACLRLMTSCDVTLISFLVDDDEEDEEEEDDFDE